MHSNHAREHFGDEIRPYHCSINQSYVFAKLIHYRHVAYPNKQQGRYQIACDNRSSFFAVHQTKFLGTTYRQSLWSLFTSMGLVYI